MRKIIVMMVCFSLMITVNSCGTKKTFNRYNQEGAEVVSIGVSYPVLINEETNFFKGVMLAQEQINRTGGVLAKRLELVVKDDENNPTIALQKAHTFSEEGITAVIGHWSTNVSYLTEQIYEENKIVMISPSSTGMSLLEENQEFIFRMIANNQVFSKELAEYIAQSGLKRIAITYSDDTYGRNFSNMLEKEITVQGITVVDRISNLSAANEVQVRDRLRAFDCEGIVLAKTLPEVKEDIRLIRKFAPTYQLFAAENLARSSFMEGKDDGTIGIHVATYPITHADKVFLEEFYEAYGTEPDIYAITGYEAVMLLCEAFESTGSLQGTEVADYIKGMGRYFGICGELTYNRETGEFDGHKVAVRTIGRKE